MSIDSVDVWLALACFVVSLFSTAVGTSAGVNFAVMATVLPPSIVLPIHGFIEGISSTIRWMLLRELVNYRFLLFFVFGSMLGFIAGWPLIGLLSDESLKILLGAFLLVTAWAPLGWMRVASLAGGAITSCLTVLVGATGPLVAALISRRESSHLVVVGTQGACTSFQHFGKTLLFSLWGFSFSSHLGLIIVLSVATVLGTWSGKRILIKVPQNTLRNALKLVVTILGVRLLLAY